MLSFSLSIHERFGMTSLLANEFENNCYEFSKFSKEIKLDILNSDYK